MAAGKPVACHARSQESHPSWPRALATRPLDSRYGRGSHRVWLTRRWPTWNNSLIAAELCPSSWAEINVRLSRLLRRSTIPIPIASFLLLYQETKVLPDTPNTSACSSSSSSWIHNLSLSPWENSSVHHFFRQSMTANWISSLPLLWLLLDFAS